MSLAARVKSIEALQGWKTSLKLFTDETRQAMQSIDRKIQREQEWLQERVHHWRHVVEECEEEVQQARRDLQECRDSEDGSCRSEEEALAEARSKLRRAEMELENAQTWKARVAEMATAYQLQADRLRRLLDGEMPRADAYLAVAISDLHMYVAGVSPRQEAGPYESVSASLTGVEGARQMDNAMTVLRDSNRGKAICGTIIQRGVNVEFGYLPDDVRYEDGKRVEYMIAAQYDPAGKTITVNIDLKNEPGNVIAPYLAHEGRHAQLDRGEQKASLAEEYEAHKAQADVWEEVKGNARHRGHENVATIISWGIQEAKAEIRRTYGDDYFSDVFGDRRT